MVQTRSFRFILSLGMILGIASLLGCAVQPQTKAPALPGTKQGEVTDLPALLAAADQAFKDGAYEGARKLYALAQQNSEGLSLQQAETVRTNIARIDSVLHERALAAQAAKEAAAGAPAAKPAAKPAEPKVAATTESARVATEQAPAQLAEVETLVAAQKYSEAAPKLAALDPLRKDMTADLKLRYDQARFTVAKASTGLPALTADQLEERAQEDFDAGKDAYGKKDLLGAQKYLLAAQAFDVSIGWLDNRSLRNTLADIDEQLADLRKSYEAGKTAFAAKDYAAADAQLSKVADSKVSLGQATDKDVQTMLAEAKAEVAKKVAAEKQAAAEKLAAAQKQAAAEKQAAEKAAAEKQAAATKVTAAPAATTPAPAPAKPTTAPAATTPAPAPAKPVPAPVATTPAPAPKPAPAPAATTPAPAKPVVAPVAVAPAAVPAKPVEPTAAQKAAAEKAAADKAAADKAAAEKAAAAKAASGEAAAAKREADGEAAYDAGMKAYDAKDYLGAKKNLEIARDSGLSFGFLGLGTRKMRNTLAEVNETLNKLQTAYKSGKSSYDAGDYDGAQKYLASVTQTGISLGKETDADIKKMMEGLDKKVADQRAVKAAKDAAAAALAAEANAKAAKDQEEQANKLNKESEDLIQSQGSVLAKMAAADQAMAAKNFAAAKQNLTDAQDVLKKPGVAALKALAAVPAQIRTKLAEADKGLAEQKRIVAAQDQLAKMVVDADAQTKTDLLVAEQKAGEARQYAQAQGVALTGQQSMMLAGVEQAIDQKYGVQRHLRRAQYGKLDPLGKTYADAGQYGSAAQIYALLADGDATMVTKTAKDAATAKAADAQRTADQQKQKASELAAAFDKARQALKDGGLDAGLKARQDIIRQAKDAKLNTDQAVIAFCDADLAFLDKDVRQAIADAAKSQASASDKLLDRARQEVKTAQQVLVVQVPPLDQKALAARRLDLAKKLNAAVVAGDAAQVASLRQQMADAGLTTQVQKALQALKQGNYDQAKNDLDAAPVADASPALRQSTYAPARAQVDVATAAQMQLTATEDALAAHDFAKAAQTIQQMQSGPKLPGLLETRLTALSAVLNAVRDAQSKLDALAAVNEQGIAVVRQTLADRKQRQTASTAYADALKALLTASAEDAAKALAAAAAAPGLTAAEAQNVSELAAGLASSDTLAQAQAEQMLAGAEGLYAAGDNTGAAQGLVNVKANNVYESNAAVKQRAADLEKNVQAREQQAETLYAQAVAAFQAGNTQEVGRLMGELKAGYNMTRAYQQHQ